MISKKINIFLLLCSLLTVCNAQETISTENTEAILYVGEGKKQALIVGLGGAEGGNAWTSDYWKKTRDMFLDKGYAFLAIGYFAAPNTPKLLEKIAIEDIHNAIKEAVKHKKINKDKIAIVGGSRGADLAMLIASYYDDIDCVVGLVASHAVFPGNTDHFTTSTWTYDGKELSFIPVNEEAIPFMMKGNIRGAFEAMLEDTTAEEKALIKVERIQGPLLLISATKDEIAPTTPMSQKIMARLEAYDFAFPKEHIAIVGKHAAPLEHFDKVFNFLKIHFPTD